MHPKKRQVQKKKLWLVVLTKSHDPKKECQNNKNLGNLHGRHTFGFDPKRFLDVYRFLKCFFSRFTTTEKTKLQKICPHSHTPWKLHHNHPRNINFNTSKPFPLQYDYNNNLPRFPFYERVILQGIFLVHAKKNKDSHQIFKSSIHPSNLVIQWKKMDAVSEFFFFVVSHDIRVKNFFWLMFHWNECQGCFHHFFCFVVEWFDLINQEKKTEQTNRTDLLSLEDFQQQKKKLHFFSKFSKLSTG